MEKKLCEAKEKLNKVDYELEKKRLEKEIMSLEKISVNYGEEEKQKKIIEDLEKEISENRA